MHQHLSFQTTPSMSSSHPYTAVDDDDDTDICPVCDGQCTCRLELDVNPQPTPPAAPPLPSLKIKFTLPPNLIAKRQQVPLTDAYTTPLKKRGRPPKHALSLPPERPRKNSAKINKVRQTLKARAAAISKKVVKRRRIAVESDQDESYSSDDTFDTSYKHYQVDPQLLKCPPAHDWIIRPRKKSVGDSDAEQMDVDTDTDDQAHNQIDQDQDGDDDDEDEEEEPDELLGVEEDEEDTDGRHRYVGLATGWSEEEDESSFDADLFFANLSDSSSTSGSSSTSTRRRCHSCTPGGIDADQSSSTFESPSKTALPFEVTENWDGHLIFTNGLVGDAESRGIVDNDFEKDAEKFMDSVDSDADDSCSSFSGIDHDQLNFHPSSIVQAPESSDTDMFSISDVDAGYEEDRGEVDEGDTTDEELVGDDSLPNEQAMRLFTLPMPISMGISAINPMSIVSPVGLEKRRHRRRMDVDEDHEERKIWRRRLKSGPRAADILAGKTMFWEDESGDGYASSSSNSMVRSGKGKQKAFPPSSPTSHASHPRLTLFPNTPRRGLFVPTGETRQAVIGDDRKGTDVPSPHPRYYSTTTTPGGDDTGNSTPYPCPAEVEVNDLACIVELDDVLEASFLDDSMDREYEAGVGSSLTPASGSTSGGVEDLSTTLATTTTIPSVVSTATVEVSNKHLTRWDVISIGAFRQTREQQQQQAWGPGSRSSSTAGDYRGVTRNGASAAGSPLSALLWQNSSTMSSPLTLPLSSTSTLPSKSRSSSRTTHSHSHSQPNDPSPTHKTRKERRREKKLLKKKKPTSSPSTSSMPRQFFSTHPNNANHFHTHQHHPNSKTRGMSSSQRMGYFGGAVPPLNL